MSVYSWILPAPPSGPGTGGSSAASLGVTVRSALGGLLDMVIDPVTLDYIDTEDGSWLETADSRTLMMMMLEIEFGASPFDPQDGTAIKAMLRSGEPVTPESLQSESIRAGNVLVNAGIISDLSVSVRDSFGNALVDEFGRQVASMLWRDLASGSPVDLVYSPTAG